MTVYGDDRKDFGNIKRVRFKNMRIYQLEPDPGADPNALNGKLTPMHRAAIAGDIELLKTYIDRGGNIEIADVRGTRPLAHAAWAGQADTIEFLLQQGAEPNHVDDHGVTPLLFATIYWYREIVETLLAAGGDPHAAHKGNVSPLDYARQHSRKELVALFESTQDGDTGADGF